MFGVGDIYIFLFGLFRIIFCECSVLGYFSRMFVLVVFWQGFKERSDIFWGSNLGHKKQGVVRSVFHCFTG